MRLLNAARYEEVFGPLRGKRVGYLQGRYGNAGDALIHWATLELFKNFDIAYRVINGSVSTLIGWPKA